MRASSRPAPQQSHQIAGTRRRCRVEPDEGIRNSVGPDFDQPRVKPDVRIGAPRREAPDVRDAPRTVFVCTAPRRRVRPVAASLVLVFVFHPQGHAQARVTFQVRERAHCGSRPSPNGIPTRKNGRLGERGFGPGWLEAVRVWPGRPDVNPHMIAADALDEVRLRRNADETPRR